MLADDVGWVSFVIFAMLYMGIKFCWGQIFPDDQPSTNAMGNAMDDLEVHIGSWRLAHNEEGH